MKAGREHIDILITRHLSGEASPDELLLLNTWLDETEANRKYFGHFKFVNDKAIASYPRQSFDSEKAWANLRTKMHAAPVNNAKAIQINKNSTYRLKIAASIIVIIGIAGFFALFMQNRQQSSQLLTLNATDTVLTQIMADKSEIVLNKGAKISYAKGYGSKNRNVSLVGEAYFKVEDNDELFFIVEAEGTFIKDLGTAFNVKAVPESLFVEVFVESGEVVFYTAYNKGIHLKQGEYAVFNKSDSTFSRVSKNVDNILSYKNLVFKFNNVPLFEVVEHLSEVYDAKLKIENEKIANYHITVSFEQEKIDHIVHIIAETLNLEVTLDNEGFTFADLPDANE